MRLVEAAAEWQNEEAATADEALVFQMEKTQELPLSDDGKLKWNA